MPSQTHLLFILMPQAQGRRTHFSVAEFKPSNDSFIFICFHLFSLTINSILPQSWSGYFAEHLIPKIWLILDHISVSWKISTDRKGLPLGPSPKFLEGTSMLHPLPTRNLPNLQDWPLYILSWDPKEMVWAHNFWSYSGSLKVSWGNSLEIWTGKYFWSMDFSPFPLNLSYPPAVST